VNDVKDVKNIAVCAGWIAGLVLAGWLLFFFTAGPRDAALMRRVNRILSARGEDFRLSGRYEHRARRLPLGTFFVSVPEEFVDSPDAESGLSFLVFPLISGGASLTCGALIDTEGRVERIIPLGTHSEQAFERLPQGILDLYIRRIEEGGQ
jgi:hypothetical protein